MLGRASRSTRSSHGRWYWLLAVGLGLTAAIALVWYPREKAQTTAQLQEWLSAMAADRGGAIDEWVKDQFADASVLAGYPTLIYLAEHGSGGSQAFAGNDPTDHARQLLTQFAKTGRKESAWLIDRDGRELVCSDRAMPHGFAAVIGAVLSSHRPQVAFERSPGGVHLGIGAPVPGRRGTAGVALFSVDPAASVYARLTSRPAFSSTAETVLVMGDGGSALFLSPLRHRPDPPLSLRVPLSSPRFAAAEALARRAAFGAFLDYRGVPVMAATRRSAVAPWALVAKIDRDEAFAGTTAAARGLAGVGLILLLAAGGVMFAFGRADDAAWVAEEARQDAELALVLDQANDPILFIDEDQRICYANRRASEVYGYGREEFLTLRLEELRAEEDREPLRQLFEAIHREGRLVHECLSVRKDRTRVRVEVSACRVSLRGKPLILALIRDLTSRHAAEEELRRTRDQLERAQRLEALGRLAGGIAHDFNNLLSVIMGFTESAQRSMPDTAPARSKLDQVLRAAERAAGLTHQLLALSRRQVMKPRPVDLNQLVADVERMLRRVIGEDVDLRVSLGQQIGCVMADPAQLEQVLLNLAVNARDAMERRGGTLEIETSNAELAEGFADPDPIAPGRYVRLAVSDAGTGIAPEVLGHIFEPFFTTKPADKGTGLGLATVYGIVRQSGGHIRVATEVGRGSTFEVFLPRIDQPAVVEERLEAKVVGGAETILVVEDEVALCDMSKEILEEFGYRVLTASRASEAMACLDGLTGPLNLLLTDIVMPGESGWSLARRIQERVPDVAILYVSGYPGDAVAAQEALAPGVELLAKPYTAAELASKVREVLDRSRRPSSITVTAPD